MDDIFKPLFYHHGKLYCFFEYVITSHMGNVQSPSLDTMMMSLVNTNFCRWSSFEEYDDEMKCTMNPLFSAQNEFQRCEESSLISHCKIHSLFSLKKNQTSIYMHIHSHEGIQRKKLSLFPPSTDQFSTLQKVQNRNAVQPPTQKILKIMIITMCMMIIAN